jgi:hypothetical protein
MFLSAQHCLHILCSSSPSTLRTSYFVSQFLATILDIFTLQAQTRFLKKNVSGTSNICGRTSEWNSEHASSFVPDLSYRISVLKQAIPNQALKQTTMWQWYYWILHSHLPSYNHMGTWVVHQNSTYPSLLFYRTITTNNLNEQSRCKAWGIVQFILTLIC